MKTHFVLLLSSLACALPAAAHGQDYNGDGDDDLAVGIPGAVINGNGNAGAVSVLYSDGNWLSNVGADLLHQDMPGFAGATAPNESFGQALAYGDFNGDGFDDLAIGVPGTTVDGMSGAGAVHVVYGSASGLTSVGDVVYHLNAPDVAGDSQAGDGYGTVLDSGDFNADGRDDLAVGFPGSRVNGRSDAGRVHIMYGGSNGLRTDNDVLWNQSATGIGVPERNDNFGCSLAVGRFNGDSYYDLAIGVRGEALGNIGSSGMVQVVYGSASGLSTNTTEIWHQDSPGIVDFAETADLFGTSLAAGDFNADFVDDLAISAPLEDLSGLSNTGAVHVIYGSGLGLTATGDRLLYQGNGLADTLALGDYTGYWRTSLVSGDFDGDGRDDLAVGCPIEAALGVDNAGKIIIAYGHDAGLGSGQGMVLHQGLGWTSTAAEPQDYFGWSLAAGDFDGDGRDDLVAGTPDENIGSDQNAGAIEVFYGPVSTGGYQLWYTGIAQERYGEGLAR